MPEPEEKKGGSPIRTIVLATILGLLFTVIVGRLFYVQAFQHGDYLEKATAQQSRKFVIPANRGEIFVQDGHNELYPIAMNQQYFVLAADPKYIQDSDQTASKLQSVINSLDPQDLKSKFDNKDVRYTVLNKRIEQAQAEKIKDMNLPGVILSAQNGRYYPEGDLFAHVTGYVNTDGVGQYGLEQFANEQLGGTDGLRKAVTDSLGVPITSSENTLVEPKNGSSYVLTIDRSVQAMAAKALEQAVTRNHAESGSVIIMDPKTGAIKALVNYPSFDPNNYQNVPANEYNRFINSAVSNSFEPGSGFKVITMSAGLDTGKVKDTTQYNDAGEVTIADRTIKNAENHKFGIQTMTDVIQKSLNTGVVFVLQQLGGDPNRINQKGKETFYNYINKFGFGRKTGVELAGEAKGYVKDTKAPDVDYANMTFGQGISTTSLQMVAAVAAIANGGTLYKPYIVDKTIAPDHSEKLTKPQVTQSNVMSSQSAATMAQMMEQVVQHGSGWPTRMKGYNIAGKTGTAQVPRADGQGYEENKNIGSFVGFAPVEDPKFVMMVRVDYPKVDGFAEQTAVPTFAEIAKQLLVYYQIPPNGN